MDLEQAFQRARFLESQGRVDDAIANWEVLLSSPLSATQQAAVLTNYGALLHRIGNCEAAIAKYESAVAVAPNFVAAHFNRAISLRVLGRLGQAIEAYRKVIAIESNVAPAHYDLGLCHQQARQLEQAEACYRRTLELDPNYVDAWLNLAQCFLDQHRFDESIAAYQRCLQLAPKYIFALNGLGVAYRNQGLFDKSQAALESALRIAPDYAEACYNLSLVFQARGETTNAKRCLEKAILIKPNFTLAIDELANLKMLTCDWESLSTLEESLVRSVSNNSSTAAESLVNPFTFLGLHCDTSPELQLRCARRWSRQFVSADHLTSSSDWKRRLSDTNRRIRIGYLSADYRQHAVGLSIPELLESHDRNRFQIFAFSIGSQDQSVTSQRLRRATEHFIDLQPFSDRQAASVIQDHEIDILFDLQGYTLHNRTNILAHRPAPIQIQYLGYPGSMGADFIDYTLVDEVIVPREQRENFSEDLLYIPGCYQVNDRQIPIDTSPLTRSDCSLPEEAVVLCCFNSSVKISQRMFSIWLETMKWVDDTVLWLPEWNHEASENLLRVASRHGIERERIIFCPKIAIDKHMARHCLADIFVDTFPYCGHATSSNALRMGLPVLTLQGKSMVSRVTSSLLSALQLPELIANTRELYLSKLIRLSSDEAYRESLRQKLCDQLTSTDVFSGAAFARKLEVVVERLWLQDTVG